MPKEITIGVSHTFRTGPYESLKIEASMTFTKDDFPDEKNWGITAQKRLRKLVEDTLRAQDHSEMRALLARIYAEKAERETGDLDERTGHSTRNRSQQSRG